MLFRSARPDDVPAIASMEATPQFRSMVGWWSETQHLNTLHDPDAAYLVAEDEGAVADFAILRGLQSEHKSLELKRIIVGIPNQGLGRRLLEAVAAKAFDDHGAHRLWLDVFETNRRALHLYQSFGFRIDGLFREAIFRDNAYHSLHLMSLLEYEYRQRDPPQSQSERDSRPRRTRR